MDEPLKQYVAELMDDYIRTCSETLEAEDRELLIRRAVKQVDAVAHEVIRQLLEQCLKNGTKR